MLKFFVLIDDAAHEFRLLKGRTTLYNIYQCYNWVNGEEYSVKTCDRIMGERMINGVNLVFIMLTTSAS